MKRRKEEDRKNEGKKKGRTKRKRGIRKTEKNKNKGNTISTISIPSLPLRTPSLPLRIPSLPLKYHPYHFHLSLSTSFGRKINISGTFFVFKSILLTCIFAFNHVIPLDIVSFYSFSHLITMHPKDRKSLCKMS